MSLRSRQVLARLDALDGRIVEAIADRTAAEAAAADILAARIQRADERAATHVAHAKDQVAAVNAELAAVRGETIRHGITDLRHERDVAAKRAEAADRQRDEAVGRAEHAEAEHARLLEAWQARGAQVDDYVRQLSEMERRAENAEAAGDEARRQHDECRIEVAALNFVIVDRDCEIDTLTAAVRSVLDHGDHEAAIAARSRGGSRTRTRQRFTHLAELTGWSES